jgi:hypothetical protein
VPSQISIVSIDQDLRLIEGSIISVGFDDVALDNVIVLFELKRTKSFRHDMAPQRCRTFRRRERASLSAAGARFVSRQ